MQTTLYVNQWNLALYDIQTNVEIAVNQSTTLSVPTFVKGANSGATGFLRHAVSAGTAVTVYETEGSFIPFEKLIFNGVEGGRVAVAITEHGIADVKSVYGIDGYDGAPTTVGINTFSADVIQSTKFSVGIATVSAMTKIFDFDKESFEALCRQAARESLELQALLDKAGATKQTPAG